MSDYQKKEFPPVALDSSWPFKKYKGQTARQVIQKDHRYVRWCVDSAGLKLTDEAAKLLKAYS